MLVVKAAVKTPAKITSHRFHIRCLKLFSLSNLNFCLVLEGGGKNCHLAFANYLCKQSSFKSLHRIGRICKSEKNKGQPSEEDALCQLKSQTINDLCAYQVPIMPPSVRRTTTVAERGRLAVAPSGQLENAVGLAINSASVYGIPVAGLVALG